MTENRKAAASTTPGQPATIDVELDGLEQSMERLLSLLDGVHSYVERVAAGKEAA